mmetsp:Transcript_4400/g.13472  ORF Transcript_4400/g.13472 Transcript_4400/m.13472 type:complete len:361 (-) Transcript_4400:812-1894(-)
MAARPPRERGRGCNGNESARNRESPGQEVLRLRRLALKATVATALLVVDVQGTGALEVEVGHLCQTERHHAHKREEPRPSAAPPNGPLRRGLDRRHRLGSRIDPVLSCRSASQEHCGTALRQVRPHGIELCVRAPAPHQPHGLCRGAVETAHLLPFLYRRQPRSHTHPASDEQHVRVRAPRRRGIAVHAVDLARQIGGDAAEPTHRNGAVLDAEGGGRLFLSELVQTPGPVAVRLDHDARAASGEGEGVRLSAKGGNPEVQELRAVCGFGSERRTCNIDPHPIGGHQPHASGHVVEAAGRRPVQEVRAVQKVGEHSGNDEDHHLKLVDSAQHDEEGGSRDMHDVEEVVARPAQPRQREGR